MAIPINIKRRSSLALMGNFLTILLVLFMNLTVASTSALKLTPTTDLHVNGKRVSSIVNHISREEFDAEISERKSRLSGVHLIGKRVSSGDLSTQNPESLPDEPPQVYEIPLPATFSNFSEACLSDWFNFNVTNVEQSGTLEWHAEWSRNELQTIKARKADSNEIFAITRNLLGTPNSGCDSLDCVAEWPTCHHIAEWGLNFRAGDTLTDIQVTELRRRYFLMAMIMHQGQYMKALQEGINGAKATLTLRYPALSEVFTDDVKTQTLSKCKMKEALIQAAVQTGLTLATAVFPMGIGTGFQLVGEAGKKFVKGLEEAAEGHIGHALIAQGFDMMKSGTIHNLGVNIATQWGRDMGWNYHSPSGSVPGLKGWSQIDTSTDSCHSVEDFMRREMMNAISLASLVEDVYAGLYDNNIKENEGFSNSDMSIGADNLTNVGRALAKQNWNLAETHGNTLIQKFKEKFAATTTKTIISQLLTKNYCYISCSDAPDSKEAHRHCVTKLKGKDDKVERAFFCPNRELCEMKKEDDSEPNCPLASNLVYKNLVCRLDCLNVARGGNDYKKGDHIEPDFPEYLSKMRNLDHYPVDTHRFFSQAVLNHRIEMMMESADDNGTFHVPHADPSLVDTSIDLPVCVSKVAYGNSYLRDASRFSPSCGDWKANQTAAFLDKLGVGKNSEIFQGTKLIKFYRKELRNLNRAASPITAFLTYCEANVPWPSGGLWDEHDKKWWQIMFGPLVPVEPEAYGEPENFSRNVTEPNWSCVDLKDAIKGMDEREANIYYCCANVVRRELDFEYFHPDRADNVNQWGLPNKLRTAGNMDDCDGYLANLGVEWDSELCRNPEVLRDPNTLLGDRNFRSRAKSHLMQHGRMSDDPPERLMLYDFTWSLN